MPTARYFENNIPGPAMENGIFVPVPAEYVPVTLSALELKKTRELWQSESDFSNGYQGVCAMQWGLLMDKSADIVGAIDRLYRLIDTSFNGTDYFVRQNPDGTTQVDPAIPLVPPDDTNKVNAMRAHLGRLWHLAENSTTGAVYGVGAGIVNARALDDERPIRDTLRDAQGLLNATWFGGGQPATIADIVRALRVGSDADQGLINNTIEEILNAGGNTTGIFNAVRQLFDTGVNTLGEGGTLAVLIASTIAQAAISGLTGAQLDAINTKLTMIDGRLVDNEQNIDIVEWTKAGTGAAQAIKAYISQGVDATTLQSLLIAIRDKPTGGGGGGGTVTLDAAQFAEMVNLLECICEATNGPPTPPAAPQFDEEICGQGWTLMATWRPTTSGVSLSGADGTWTTESGVGPLLSVDIGPNGENVLVFDPSGQPYDCRVWFAYADDYTGFGTGAVEPWRTDELAGGPGRPAIQLNVPRSCQTFSAYGLGAQTQPIGYAVYFSVDAAHPPLSADNFAVFVTFSAFG